MIRNGSVVLALILALFLAPLRGVPFANGPPLESPWELILIALLVGVFALTASYPVRPTHWALLLVTALLVVGSKIAISQHQLPHGLVGRYRVDPPGVGPPWERTLHHPLPNATRLDGPLAFYNTGYRPGRPPFPFFFLNDQRRHPWIGKDPTVQPTVSVQWDGYLAVERSGTVGFRLDTPDTCSLSLDNRELTPPGQGLEHCYREVVVNLSAGLHRLQATYAQHITDLNAPSPQSRLLLQWRHGTGLWETVPAQALLPFRPTTESLEQDRHMMPLARGVFWGQWLLLALGLVAMIQAVPNHAWRGDRGFLACWVPVFIALALVTTLRDARNPSSNYLWLGWDDIQYETEARAYLTESWLTTPSEGSETKVVYVYFLALAHLLFGESLIQVVLLHRLLVVSAALLIYWIGKTYFSPRAGMLAMAMTILSTQLFGWSRALYPATLGAFLVVLALVCTLKAHRRASALWMVGAGAVLALAIHTRPNFVLCYAIVPLWLAVSHRPWRRGLVLMGLFVLGAGLVEGLAMIRSLAAYGHLIHSQGVLSINLARGNPIPPSVDLSNVSASGPLGLPGHLWAMWAFVTQEPLAFAVQWLHKFFYLFGINTMGSVWNPSLFTYEIFFFSAGGLLGGALAVSRYGQRATWLPLAFVAANGAVLIATAPDLHGFRLLVPLIPLLAIYVGVVLETFDLSQPLQASWKTNLLRGTLFFTLLPFRYGLQYALMGAAYLWPITRKKRVSIEPMDELT